MGFKKNGPTMKDVAALADVSVKTVSRFINGETNIDPALAARIEEAVKALQYRRNMAAASIRPGWTSKMVGLIISDLGNPFYSVLARVLEQVIASQGYLLTVSSSSDDPEGFNNVLDRFMELRLDGVIMVPPRLPGEYRILTESLATPIVFLDRLGMAGSGDSVIADNRGGAYDGVSALIGAGARNIVFIGDSLDVFTMRQRLSGFESACYEAGIPEQDMRVLSGAHSAAQGYSAAMAVLDDPNIDAVFAANNRATLGTLRAFADRERTIPLVGFDDFETADLIAGGISVVQQDVEQMAKEAGRLLLGRMKGNQDVAEHVTVPTTFVSRGSEFRTDKLR